MISHIDALCAAGLLVKEARRGPNGKRSNVYMLTLNGESPAHPDVQEMYIACAGVAQTHSAGAAHRISHSLDPVIDPKIPPISPQGERAAESSAPRRGTRLPNDWFLPAEWGRWASQETGWPRERILLEAATFADYWQSLPGAIQTVCRCEGRAIGRYCHQVARHCRFHTKVRYGHQSAKPCW